jgi:hypothetical protein
MLCIGGFLIAAGFKYRIDIRWFEDNLMTSLLLIFTGIVILYVEFCVIIRKLKVPKRVTSVTDEKERPKPF